MPKLWTETIETHRREVRDAILDAAAALVFRDGLRAATMSQIAVETKIGRATLYKYFPDVDAILRAWHAREIAGHLHRLHEIRDAASATGRLEAVLRAYALISHQARHHHDADIVAALSKDEHLEQAHRQLHGLVCGLLAERAETGTVRGDVAPTELASYCLHALGAARDLRSQAAVHRLITVTLAALDPPS